MYIYDKNERCIAQIEDIIGIEIEHEMSDSSSASVAIFHDNPAASKTILKKQNHVIIAQKIGPKEQEMFNGYIRGLNISLEIIKIIMNDKIRNLGKRYTHHAYEYTNEKLEVMLKRIWSDINNIHPLGLEFVCNAPDIIPKKSYGKKTSLLSILKDWKEKNYEFRIFGNKLVFGKSVGRDRTKGELFKEYSYDITTPDNNTILKATMVDDADDIANALIDENNNFYKNSNSIEEYGFLEKTISLDGKNPQSYLEESKDGVQVFEIEGKVDNFFEVEIGDIVKVYINRNNDLMNYDGNMEILEKKYVGGDLPKITYKFSSAKNSKLDFLNKLKNMEERIKKLEEK